ncbi:MAG: hypothetical protein A2Y62_12390 [Candidatus Fischerbacteria bacterium RBG_13_37_8]|uniref:HTH arsR-type domain-containing protein n=1 Tax=Candidatus Fischerbacteria bacterium RBG_13_37_8 TaxID=1817863 RepID=A0A1F5VTI4_9BACT|nr:MAG: hypothetical protein A2Y62_12390 [Candidatus Fischerbacteria bacterium RBG_13_37_8]
MNNIKIQINKYTTCFKALSDKTRLRIFYILSKLKKELAVCEIMDAIAESQYNVSRHLQILKHAGLIKENKKGRWVLYSINEDNDLASQLVQTVLALKPAYFKDDMQRAKARLKKRCKGKIVFCLNQPLKEKFDE